MADDQQMALLRQDVNAWNQWRIEHPEVIPDLKRAELRDVDLEGADLRGADLSWANLLGQNLSNTLLRKAELTRANLVEANLVGVDLSETSLYEAFLVNADLSGANLMGADLAEANLNDAILTRATLHGATLIEANLSGACLSHANLTDTTLTGANLSDADLHNACLVEADLGGAVDVPEIKLLVAVFSPSRSQIRGADLTRADLTDADLTKANLSGANLLETNLTRANLTGCSVYGISAWNVRLDGAIQTNLRITRQDEPALTVGNLEMAQFLYLLLNGKEIRQIIDTITSKVVLIIGRFTPQRKAVLDALHDELSKHDYLPVVFDFEKPGSRDITETVSTLAHMARFVIADLTEAKSVPQELAIIVPTLPSVPIQPLILEGEEEYGMFEHWQRYPWVLDLYRYPDIEGLLANLKAHVIEPAERRANELAPKNPESE